MVTTENKRQEWHRKKARKTEHISVFLNLREYYS
jgi:hypothetical protein